MGALTILATLWRWRFSILLLASIAGAFFWKLHADSLRADAEEGWRTAELAEQVNAENLTMLRQIEAEKKRAEQILGERLARKSREADQLGRLVQHVLAQDASRDCPVGAALDAALDGLPDGDGGQGVGQP